MKTMRLISTVTLFFSIELMSIRADDNMIKLGMTYEEVSMVLMLDGLSASKDIIKKKTSLLGKEAEVLVGFTDRKVDSVEYAFNDAGSEKANLAIFSLARKYFDKIASDQEILVRIGEVELLGSTALDANNPVNQIVYIAYDDISIYRLTILPLGETATHAQVVISIIPKKSVEPLIRTQKQETTQPGATPTTKCSPTSASST